MSTLVTRRAALTGAFSLAILTTTPKLAFSGDDPVPFKISIPDSLLADLKDRLAKARLPAAVDGAGWGYGADRDAIAALVSEWQAFDWRSFETKLNALPQFTTAIDGETLHFIHAKGKGPNAIPLLILHGWPSSIVQFMDIIPLLTDPALRNDGSTVSFDVVAVSLPGFGFSSQPTKPGMSVGKIAGLIHKLMVERLRYARFAARGSDLGAGVIQQLALTKPDSLLGIHLSGTNPFVAFQPPDMNAEEKAFVEKAGQWMQSEMAYAMLHSTKPQTPAFALNDSPSGLAAWIFEKFHAWTDRKDDVIGRYGREKLLANLTIYWVTQTIGSSMRLYAETARDQSLQWGRVTIPTAMLMTPHDMFPTPRAWANRSWNVTRWTEIDKGGHFLEWEEPALVAKDLAAFFGD
jgi:pimeloyl-ACP methyl ester carboxylesterase